LKISIFDPFPFISGLVPTGGDCMATGSDAKRKATEAVAVQFCSR